MKPDQQFAPSEPLTIFQYAVVIVVYGTGYGIFVIGIYTVLNHFGILPW